jgi:hypothetical protein
MSVPVGGFGSAELRRQLLVADAGRIAVDRIGEEGAADWICAFAALLPRTTRMLLSRMSLTIDAPACCAARRS